MQRFFAPGRTELAGNHTDHQLGRVLAASVDVGITARATRRRDRRVCIHSKGYRPFTVALDDLAVDPRAYGKPWALVRGMAAAILDAGGAVGGFEAWASSALKPGGGLSSSAAFEILVGRIFNALYNGGAFSPEQLAHLHILPLCPEASYPICFGYLSRSYPWSVLSEFIRIAREQTA